MTRRIIAAVSAAALAVSLAAGTALAGQPNQSCEEQPLAPAGFSTGGFATAEAVYAGSGSGSLHANSANAVSQYDVACYELSLHH
jgi:hypothetical protein